MTRVLFLTFLMLGPLAEGQILPRSPLPGGLPGSLPAGAVLPGLEQQTTGALTDDVWRLEHARKLGIRLLLRRHADVIEADPNGDPIVRGEVLAFSPTAAALAHALSAGFRLVRDRSLGPLGIRIVVFSAPHGTTTSRALSLLRRADPAGIYDFNNLYAATGARVDAEATAAGRDGPHSASAAAASLGLIDGGVGTTQPVFAGVAIHQYGCGGAVLPSAHGTEVASLMVGRSARFGGAAPGATLYAADVYCNQPTGGAVDAIAAALAWLAGQQVPVINVSLVGPPNGLLQEVVARLVDRGFLIVAAVGNDGPAAAPLYPAAYPGVVGVTAVDARRQVIFEAERGRQVMFAAPGADIPAAGLGGAFEPVRGTSYAAPLVAGLLAKVLYSVGRKGDQGPAPGVDSAAAHAAIDALAHAAAHLGAPGRNPAFGYGLVGADLPSPRPAPGE